MFRNRVGLMKEKNLLICIWPKGVQNGGDLMNIDQTYLDGLKEAYYENGGEKQWNNFERVMHGASDGDRERLRSLYPDIPKSLLQLDSRLYFAGQND